MDRDEYGRLVRAEVTLEVLEERVDDVRLELLEHRKDSALKHEAVIAQLVLINGQLAAGRFRWSDLLNKTVAKVVLAVLGGLLGGGSAASIVKALFND